jgi:peroxiredoxin
MRWRDVAVVLVVAAAFAALARLVGPAELAPPPLPQPSAETRSAGSLDAPRAAALELRDLDGRPRSLGEHAGRVVLVNFWATWCPPCREELPALQALHGELADEGLVVLGVAVDAGAAEPVAAFAAGRGVGFPLLHDPGGDAARRWGVRAYPTSFVVDGAGRLRHVAPSAWDRSHPDAVAWLRALLAEES